MSRDEVRKAKTLYPKNAITEYKVVREGLKVFGCVQMFFWIIPIFWPILFIQRRSMRLGMRFL